MWNNTVFMAQVKYISVMLRGLSSKWLQNASRSLSKCAICEAQYWCCSSVHQKPPPTNEDFSLRTWKWWIIAHTVLQWQRWGSSASTEPSSPHTESFKDVTGNRVLSPAHSLDSFKLELLFPTCACGSVSLPWSVPHFKWSMRGFFINCDGFVIATQCCLLRRILWISLIAVSFPPFPPQMQIQIHLKGGDLLTSNRNFYAHKRIRNSLV